MSLPFLRFVAIGFHCGSIRIMIESDQEKSLKRPVAVIFFQFSVVNATEFNTALNHCFIPILRRIDGK